MRILLTGLALALLLMATTSRAEMYRWVDEKGVVTFKDYPPPVSKKRKVKVYSDSDFDPAPPRQSPAETVKRSNQRSTAPQPTPSKNERFNGTVEMYVTDWCGYCKKAAAYMKSRNIPFVAYDIEKDNGAKQRHKELGGRGVPLIIVGNNRMSGFSPETLEYYLGNR